MPLPRWLGRFNRVVTNRILGLGAGRLPGFGIITHQGRRSGRRYRTPVGVFRRPGQIVIALTYGPNVDWVRNVLAAGHAEIITRRRTYRLVNPRLVEDAERSLASPPVRPILRALDVDAFLVADVTGQ
jgi:deazaflavin-dependent oxidoreductase (nitroreductase family)